MVGEEGTELSHTHNGDAGAENVPHSGSGCGLDHAGFKHWLSQPVRASASAGKCRHHAALSSGSDVHGQTVLSPGGATSQWHKPVLALSSAGNEAGPPCKRKQG